MSIIDPFARRLEEFIYHRVCGLSQLSAADGSDRASVDLLASPVEPAPDGHRRR